MSRSEYSRNAVFTVSLMVAPPSSSRAFSSAASSMSISRFVMPRVYTDPLIPYIQMRARKINHPLRHSPPCGLLGCVRLEGDRCLTVPEWLVAPYLWQLSVTTTGLAGAMTGVAGE